MNEESDINLFLTNQQTFPSLLLLWPILYSCQKTSLGFGIQCQSKNKKRGLFLSVIPVRVFHNKALRTLAFTILGKSGFLCEV